MAKAITRAAIAKKKRKIFLRMLAETGGNVLESSKAVGYADPSYLFKMRREDEEFAAEWDQAVEAGAAVLEAEAIRRATEGVLEPVFYKGDVAGYKTNYSDSLLMFMLRAMKPDVYRENRNGGETNINFGIAVLPMQAKDDDDWERRAVNMHNAQEIIEVPDKPVENTLAARTVKRSD